MKKLHTNKTDINNTKYSDTESNLISSENDRMGCDADTYKQMIEKNIELQVLKQKYPHDDEMLDGIMDLILETVLCQNETIVIASSKYPAELVRSKLLRLNTSHVEYAMDCLKANTTKIRNIKKYLLATLFNAPSTISGYFQSEVNYDMIHDIAK